MNTSERSRMRLNRGVGLIEIMISIIIAMLLVLVIYQVYEISEGQKRTITAGSDAQQNASFGMYVLGRDLSMAGNGIASAAASLDTCAMLRPIPVLIDAGASAGDPDTITVLYGGSSALSTPVQFKQTATTAQPYVVPGPVGFSADPVDPNKTDVIVAVQGGNCTLSTINAGGVAVDALTGFATLTHTPVAGNHGGELRRRQRDARQSRPARCDGAHRVHGRHGGPYPAHAEPAADGRPREPHHQRRRQSEGTVRPRYRQRRSDRRVAGRHRRRLDIRQLCRPSHWRRCDKSVPCASRSSRAARNTRRTRSPPHRWRCSTALAWCRCPLPAMTSTTATRCSKPSSLFATHCGTDHEYRSLSFAARTCGPIASRIRSAASCCSLRCW